MIPRLFSIILLVISLGMVIPLVAVVRGLLEGKPVAAMQWLVPLVILGTASIMTGLLTRRTLPMRLYVAAFALWLVTAGYFLYLLNRA